MLKCVKKTGMLAVFLPALLPFSISGFPGNDRPGRANGLGPRDSQFIVVLDAGHGGDKSGARGEYSLEKNITLAITLKVGNLLQQSYPDIKVIYTRTSDIDVPLYERAEIANHNKADLFISIHCNSTPYHYTRKLVGHRTVRHHGKRRREPVYRTYTYRNTSLRGTGAYVLRIGRTDEKKEALKDNFDIAQTENADIYTEKNYQQHYSGFDAGNPTNMILLTYAASSYLRQSMEFANTVEQEFSQAGRPTIGVFQQGLAVLAGSAMPSVLIETDYINNPEGERYLNSQTGQDQIASLIVKAIVKYKNEVRHGGTLGAAGGMANEESGNATAYSPVTYKIQLLVSETHYKPSAHIFRQLDSAVTVEPVTGSGTKTYRYMMGSYKTEDEADRQVNDIRLMGFRDAYAVPYQEGKRLGD